MEAVGIEDTPYSFFPGGPRGEVDVPQSREGAAKSHRMAWILVL